MMQLDEAMRQRHSVRSFLNKPVSYDDVIHLLDNARQAPSGANTQPWQVAVVTGQAKQRLSEAMLRAFTLVTKTNADYQYYPLSWQQPYLDRRRACGLQLYRSLNITKKDKAAQQAQWAANYRSFDAPVMLLFWMNGLMQTGSYLDLGMFLQNIMLCATAQGLATCPQAALAEYPDIVRSQLALPDDGQIVCGMALGYEDNNAAVNQYRTARAEVETFTRFYN